MELGTVRSRAWAWYLAGVVFVGQYYVVSAYGAQAGDGLYLALGVSALIAAVVGLAMHRPPRLLAWIAVAASIGGYLAADAVLAQLEADNLIVPFPSLADWLYLGVSIVLVVAFVSIRRTLAPGRDRAATIDALLVGVAALGVLGPLYLVELWNSPFFDSSERWVAVAYPVTDAALLAAGARLVFAAGRRVNALTLLGGAAAAAAIGNAVYNAEALGSGHEAGGIASVGWIAFTCLLGGALLHPSVRATEPVDSTDRRWPSGTRIVAAAAVIAAHVRWGGDDSQILTAACLVTVVVLGVARGVVSADDRADDESGERSEPLRPAESDFVAELPASGAGALDDTPVVGLEPALHEPASGVR